MTKPNEEELYVWCLEQAAMRYRGELSLEQMAKLDVLGFPWELYERKLDELGFDWDKDKPKEIIND